jgi:hypothetical protein
VGARVLEGMDVGHSLEAPDEVDERDEVGGGELHHRSLVEGPNHKEANQEEAAPPVHVPCDPSSVVHRREGEGWEGEWCASVQVPGGGQMRPGEWCRGRTSTHISMSSHQK